VSCAAVLPGGAKDETVILLDGLNNPGFSGGPVVAPDMFVRFENVRPQKLIAVISGYRSQDSPINVDGKAIEKASTPTNTGIILATPIERAVEMIKTYVDNQKTP
jgi:hypothetical protein